MGRGFPTRSDLAIRMDADEQLVHLTDIYGAPTMCQVDRKDPNGDKTDEVPALVELASRRGTRALFKQPRSPSSLHA